MRTRQRILLGLLLICLLLLHGLASAANIPQPPTRNIYVSDFASMMDAGGREKILSTGRDLEKKTKAQLVIVTVNSLEGESIEDYANTLFRAWGIGQQGKDNGVLLLIAKEDRKFRIEVGYGLEGAITDGYSGEVLDGMVEDFRQEEYTRGIVHAYGKLAKKIYEEYQADPSESAREVLDESEDLTLSDMLYIVLMIIFILFCVYHGGGSGGGISIGGSSSGGGGGGFGGGRSGGGGASGGW